jgi:hypothetical protein
MATVINNRSSLETDPIRNFRFLVIIKPHAFNTANGSSTYGSVAPTASLIVRVATTLQFTRFLGRLRSRLSRFNAA